MIISCFQHNFQQLLILFVLQNYSLFYNIMMLDLFINYFAVRIMAVA